MVREVCFQASDSAGLVQGGAGAVGSGQRERRPAVQQQTTASQPAGAQRTAWYGGWRGMVHHWCLVGGAGTNHPVVSMLLVKEPVAEPVTCKSRRREALRLPKHPFRQDHTRYYDEERCGTTLHVPLVYSPGATLHELSSRMYAVAAPGGVTLPERARKAATRAKSESGTPADVAWTEQ